jgi:hypothetical protein
MADFIWPENPAAPPGASSTIGIIAIMPNEHLTGRRGRKASAMTEPKIWTFFYGSYINLDVLREVNYVPEQWEVARLASFEIQIQPRANLVHSNQHSVYGILATGGHAELGRLYAHAKDVLGESYLPEAVLAETLDGKWKPALCYICSAMDPRPATDAYIDRIVVPARGYGFPDWYIQRLESFRP